MSLLGRLFSRGGMDHYRRGILLYNQKEYEEAARELEAALATLGDRNDPYHNLGRFYAAEAHAKLGLALLEQDRRPPAREQFEKALEQGYRYPDLHFHLSRILAAEGALDEAVRHCRRALEINPGYLEARAQLAVLLWEGGATEDAAAELRRLQGTDFRLPPRLALDPASRCDPGMMREVREEILRRQESQEHARRALEAYERGDRDRAREEMRQAVAQNPEYADLRCKLGILYAESGETELAETELNEALRINPNYVEARLQAGLLCLRQDNAEQAIVHLDIAARLESQYPDVALFRERPTCAWEDSTRPGAASVRCWRGGPRITARAISWP